MQLSQDFIASITVVIITLKYYHLYYMLAITEGYNLA